jgi:hypothetical protein
MNRRSMLSIAALVAFGLAILPVSSQAQNAQQPQQQRPPGANAAPKAAPAPAQPKSLKDALVGSWTLLIADNVMADGTHVPEFGPNAMGVAMFGADGHYSIQLMRAVRPKFAANNRLKGTADENKAAVQGMISHFGTYSVNEADKTLTLRIEGSSFPNWDGTAQKRTITAMNPGDVVTWNVPAPAEGVDHAEIAWKWAK